MKQIKILEGPRNALEAAVEKRDLNTLEMVRTAIQHRQVVMAYQPIVQAAAPNRIAFYEGLVRILDETGRIIPAGGFIDAIEDTEMGRMIDCIALEKGLYALSRESSLRLSLNMSARSIGYRKWSRTLARGLSRDPTIAERLILEITERSAMLVPELVVALMHDLQSKGISFALDDFGAGYTAFRHFKDFHFDILKIDGQFVRGISQDADNQVITRAMVLIAQQFDMFTVAEFVENAADAAYLAEMGIDCLQGYYFGAPSVAPHWMGARNHALRA